MEGGEGGWREIEGDKMQKKLLTCVSASSEHVSLGVKSGVSSAFRSASLLRATRGIELETLVSKEHAKQR